MKYFLVKKDIAAKKGVNVKRHLVVKDVVLMSELEINNMKTIEGSLDSKAEQLQVVKIFETSRQVKDYIKMN